MPKALHDKLERAGRKKGFKGERLRKYVYGGMRATGWKPSREKNPRKALEKRVAKKLKKVC